jgi:hypothetical protein
MLLPGRAKRAFGLFTNDRQRLYLGDDHLFVTTTSYYYERYKRFYLADIQSLTIQKTAAGAILNVVLGLVAGLFAMLAATGYALQWDPGAQIFMVIVAGAFLGVALVHTAFGPTCQCHILTAVHEEPLFCLGRLYTALRVVEYLRTAIEAAQGTVGEMADATAVPAQRIERAAAVRDSALMLRKDTGQLHLALFIMLIIDAILGGVVALFRDSIPSGLALVSNITIITLLLAAAIRQRTSDVPREVRASLWVAMVFNVVMISINMYISVFLQALQQTPDADAIAAIQTVHLTVGNGINFVVNSATGLFGLYFWRLWRRAVSAQAEQQRIASEESGAA